MSGVIDNLCIAYCALSFFIAIIYCRYINKSEDANRIKEKVVIRKESTMFIEENMRVCVVTDSHETYEGTVYRIVIQPCEDDNNRPHALIFISQDKESNNQDTEYGCIALWVDKIKSISVI